MTNGEAIKVIVNNYPPSRYSMLREGLDLAIKALEKQIKQKPIEYYDGYADGYPVIEFSCPCCGTDVEDTDHHCICGQCIDWSECE